jgi:acyl carrier protein
MRGGEMTEAEIRAKVDKVLIEGFEIDPAAIRAEALMREDLGLDSLDAVDLVVALEKQFGLRIEEAEARKMRVLKDVYDYIQRKLPAAGR